MNDELENEAMIAKQLAYDVDREIMHEVAKTLAAEKSIFDRPNSAIAPSDDYDSYERDAMREIMKLAEVAVDWAERSGIMNDELLKAEREQQLNDLQAEIDTIDTPSDAYDRAMTVFKDDKTS